MFLAVLMCSDEECTHTAEQVGSLEELDAVLCADCDCLMQVVHIEGVRAEAQVVTLRPAMRALSRAA
jgi:hypothetical protein